MHIYQQTAKNILAVDRWIITERIDINTMRRVKITKNIVDKNTWIMGLSKQQIVIGAIGLVVAGLSLWGMWSKVQTELMMGIIFFEILIVASIGFIKIDGLSLIQVFFGFFKKIKVNYHTREDDIYDEKK